MAGWSADEAPPAQPGLLPAAAAADGPLVKAEAAGASTSPVGAQQEPEQAAAGDAELAQLEAEEEGQARLEGVAKLASQVQPKGNTLASAGVGTKVRAPMFRFQGSRV